jgi:structural maintenance of chromosome 1
MAELRELSKKKPRGRADENLVAEVTRLESAITLAKDDLNACKLRLTGIKDELKHLDREIKKNVPELGKLQTTYDNLHGQISDLRVTVEKAEDGIFAPFCRKIKVPNIREYEERQLKLAQEESEARLRFDNQIARLTHQAEFEEEGLKASRERLSHLDNILQADQVNLEKHEAQKAQIQREINDLEEQLDNLKEQVAGHQEVLDEKTKTVEQVKKTTMKAGKVLDQALKDISSCNDEIEKLALERSSIYRKCRVEEVKLPLLQGHLKNVPMEEVNAGFFALSSGKRMAA